MKAEFNLSEFCEDLWFDALNWLVNQERHSSEEPPEHLRKIIEKIQEKMGEIEDMEELDAPPGFIERILESLRERGLLG